MDDASEHALSFEQAGDDLLVRTRIRANDSPHVLWTGVVVQQGRLIPSGGRPADATAVHRIILQYGLVQSRDLLRRSFKYVDVTWRVPGHSIGAGDYSVEQTFCPTSAELRLLMPQLKALAEGG